MNLLNKLKAKFSKADAQLLEIEEIGSSLSTGELNKKKPVRMEKIKKEPEKTTSKKELRPA